MTEEAWHSDASVIQHAFGYAGDTWNYSWTQEWARRDTPHVFGYSIPVDLDGGETNLGDVSVSYRYQTSINEAITGPRLSFVVPASIPDEPESRRFGLEVALPLSLAHSERLASHWNLRIGWFDLEEGSEQEIVVGAAIVVAPGARSVALLETEMRHVRTVVPGIVEEESLELTVSPGFRHAFVSLRDSGIVPGISLPVTFSAGDRRVALVFHAMFEHPFGRALR